MVVVFTGEDNYTGARSYYSRDYDGDYYRSFRKRKPQKKNPFVVAGPTTVCVYLIIGEPIKKFESHKRTSNKTISKVTRL